MHDTCPAHTIFIYFSVSQSASGMTGFKIWNSCSFLVVLPVLFSLYPETVQTKPSATRDEAALRGLRCIFWAEPTQPCSKKTGYVLRNRLVQMYENMNEEMKESIRTGKLETMKPRDFAKLPASLFLLIPSQHLENISGSSLAALLSNSQDVAVAVKILENLNTGLFKDFFFKLEGVELAPQIQDIIAKMLVNLLPDVNNSWTYPTFRIIERIGNPLLAHLPPYFLANLTKTEASKFLFHLRNWLWSNLPTDMWHGKSEASKRAWTDLMLRSSYPYKLSEWGEDEMKRFRYFLEGATPDELKQLTAKQFRNILLFRTKLSRLKVQALFSILYSNKELSSANLTDTQLLPVALHLSPANLQRFSVSSTDFRVLTPLFDDQRKFCSYTTAKQIVESLIAQSVLSGRLESVEPETWGNGIKYLGKFIYVLPVSAFGSYMLSPPAPLVQSILDSDRITAKQARLLTGSSLHNLEKLDLIMGQKGLLRALSSSQITTAGTLPQNVLYHFLANLPSGMPMQAAALLQKAGRLIGDSRTLEKILSNKDPNQFFEVLPSRTVAAIVTDLENIKGFDDIIKGLTRNILSVLLTATRKELTNLNGIWTSDILLSGGPHLALLGLTCNDIYAMETVDFIYIMEQYNKVSKTLNKPFPKDLQYCSQMALMNYLKMKASLQDVKHSQLLDYLEPAEIEAVGGYILATLPTQDVDKAINSQHILEKIGQLSLPELIVATKEIKPYNYAQLLLKKHTHASQVMTYIRALQLSSLGNLVHFLSAPDIVKINADFFKLFIESVDNPTSKVICADSAARSAWYHIIRKAFGEPLSWTSATLATLGDFLLVVPSDKLNSIPVESWRDAADTLTEQTSYHMKVEWPGMVDPVQLYQACAEVLEDSESFKYVVAVHGLARWYLAAVQNQLNTVVNASQLLALVNQPKKGKMVIPSFAIEVQHPDTIVKVLEPDNVEQPTAVKRPGAEMEFSRTDQYDKTTAQVTTSLISTDFHVLDTLLKPQILPSVLDSSYTTPSEQSETFYIVKETLPPLEVMPIEITESSDATSARNSATAVTSIMPAELTTASAVLQTSNESDQTLNIPSLKVSEKLDTSEIDNTEIATQIVMQTSKSGNWSSRKFHEGNKIESDNYLTSVKGLTETTHSPKFSLEGTTSAYPETATVHSSSVLLPSDVHSNERNGELLTVIPNKFAESVENKTVAHEIKLVISPASHQVNGTNISFKVDEEIPPSLRKTESKNLQIKRCATLEDRKEQKSSRTVNVNNQAEESGDILRGVIRTNALISQTKPPAEAVLNPETEMTSVQPTESTEMTIYWQKVSCDAIRATGLSAGLALDETDIELMGLEELEMCVDTLGSLELNNRVQKKIWSLVNKDKLLENLSDLGHLVKAVDVDDISKINLNLSSPTALDNLATLSRMVMDSHVLHEIGNHFLRSNPDMKKLTVETTMALGRILCEVLTVPSLKFHNLLEESLFLQASRVLGRMKDCPTLCLRKLAYWATKSSEYGSPDTWTAEDVATLGSITTGLTVEQWRQLSSTGYGNNPLVGLTPSAVRCIPSHIFKELDDDQLKSLPTLSAAVVSDEQLSQLSESQRLALERVRKEIPALEHSADTDYSTTDDNTEDSSTSSMDLNLLVIFALPVISRFSA